MQKVLVLIEMENSIKFQFQLLLWNLDPLRYTCQPLGVRGPQLGFLSEFKYKSVYMCVLTYLSQP